MNCRKWLLQITGVTLVVLPLVGCNTSTPEPTPIAPTLVPSPTPVPPKRALFVIQSSFNPSEYGDPRTLLEEKGVVVTVAASSLGVMTSYGGQIDVQPDILLRDAHAADYDVIVFVGGYPYDENDAETHRLAQEAVAEGKTVAAICNAVIALAKAGVLEDKQVTSLTYHEPSALENEGAILTDAAVERDGSIITGNGPGASREFAEAIATALEE